MAKMVCSFLTPVLLERLRDLAGLTFILAQDNSSSIRPFNGKRLVTLSKISLEGEQLFHWWHSNSPIHWPRTNENHLPVAAAAVPSNPAVPVAPLPPTPPAAAALSNSHNSLTATAFPSPAAAAVAVAPLTCSGSISSNTRLGRGYCLSSKWSRWGWKSWGCALVRQKSWSTDVAFRLTCREKYPFFHCGRDQWKYCVLSKMDDLRIFGDFCCISKRPGRVSSFGGFIIRSLYSKDKPFRMYTKKWHFKISANRIKAKHSH